MMTRARMSELAFFALRVVAGTLFALHGAQKVFGLWGGPAFSISTQLGIGGVIELVTGILIAIGLFARPAAFVASGEMAIAYFQFHWKGMPFDARAIPFVNNGEAAVLYCFLFLCIAATGAGRLSIDGRRGAGT